MHNNVILSHDKSVATRVSIPAQRPVANGRVRNVKYIVVIKKYNLINKSLCSNAKAVCLCIF